MKKVNTQSEFPNTPHYAIITFETTYIHHEGDERSRTNPGHGYPAHTETIRNLKYLSFDKTEEGKIEWENKLKELYKADPKRTDVVGFEASSKVSINTSITIEK